MTAGRAESGPRISAVMPARDAETTIGEAIESVLAQDLGDFELLVVDDGSRDATARIAESFTDGRVIVHRSRRVGRGAARNIAIRHARGRYLAITDADDVSLPQRFRSQANHLDAHAGLHAVGAQMAYFGEWGGPSVEFRYPLSPAAVTQRLARRRMPLAHAASMFRTRTVRQLGGYDTECVRCQDFELVLRMPPGSVAALDDVLVHYRSDRFPSLPYVLETALFHRLALARSAAKRAGRPPPSLRDLAGPGRRAGWAVCDSVRWAVLKATAPARRGRRLG